MRSLKSCSDKELLNRLQKLVKQEHNLTLEILPHLIEVENRKIYRALGYSSMFVYCTDGLGYSESAANRRICAARAIRKCPEAYDYLRDGRVNLSTLSIVWRYITRKLLVEIIGKSQRQVFRIVARFEPRIQYRDDTRPVVIRLPAESRRERQPARAFNGSCGLALTEPEQCSPKTDARLLNESSPELGEILHRSGGKNLATSEPSRKMKTVVMHQVNCLVDDQVMQMLDRCKELLSGKHPCGIDYNTLMLELAQTWLEKHDPVQRAERREKRKTSQKPRGTDPGETSRYISPATRDAVYNRDKGRCTYTGSNGKRCESTWDLEIHHDEVPFARGGSHSITNLRLLCAAHNKLDAEKVFGQKLMKKYVKQRE